MRKAGIAAAALGLAIANDAHAQAYQLEAGKDVPIVLISGAVASSFLFVEEAPGRTCVDNCDKSKVNGFDRWAAGRYSLAWSRVGDVGVAATTLFGPLVLMLEEGWKNGANDNLVVIESVLATSALQVTMSYAVPRARPRVYGNEAPLEERNDANAGRSFFSGHTADAVASVVATTRTLHRLGKTTLGWVVLGAGLAGSAFVGTARVLSGGHFPSDILIGGAAGAGFGLLLPWLHASPVSVAPLGGNGLMLTGAW
jgi:membrane-associated phospholipid phosphatase